jgi:hypothetical protein
MAVFWKPTDVSEEITASIIHPDDGSIKIL